MTPVKQFSLNKIFNLLIIFLAILLEDCFIFKLIKIFFYITQANQHLFY